MKHIQLEKDLVPALGFGTWQMKGDECREAVTDALEIGYRHIDTAQMYGNEEAVGEALEASGVPREEVFLTTKVWWDDLRHDDAIRSAEESLRKLRTDHVDLLLIHWPNPEVPLDEPLRAFEQLRDQGRVAHLGVSNFPPDLLRKAMNEAPVACDQVECHPFLAQRELVEMCQEDDLMLTAYAPLARGEVEEDPTLKRIGQNHGKEASQVALRWLLQHDRVAAIPKAASPEHRRTNFDVFDFELDPEEMLRIDGLDRGERLIDPDFAPQWNR